MTAVPDGVPAGALDELYCLPLDEFTPRRDALARDLRAGGERDAAAWVKGLRKPTAAAWIVNQLARSRTRERDELLKAAGALRDAHERLVAGKADASELRSASEAADAAAQALLADAAGFLDRAGHSPSAATLEKVAQTVRAVALDEEARAGLESGRLTRERAASGFGPFSAPAATAARRTGRTRRDATEKRKAALKEARATRRERARAVTAAERDLATAEREAERAVRGLDHARAAVEEARSRLAEADAQVKETERA